MNLNASNDRSSTVVAVIITTVALLMGGWAISELTPWLMGPQASAEAQQIDALMRLMMFIGGIVFLLVQGLIVWAMIFYRRRPDDDTDGPNIHGNFTLEFVWTVIPTIIVFILTIYSYQVFFQTQAEKDNELTVSISAQRYAFGFEYFDEATDTVLNDTVLRTYVDRPVRLDMNSEDVIHAFWIPAMRVKQDMLPGRETSLRFTPTEPGVYPVVCTELCGGGHGAMRAEILVYPSEESYMDWFDQQVDCQLNPPEDPVTRGRQILASGQYPCAGCHVLDDLADAGWVGNIGPSMNGIGDRAVTQAAAAGDPDAEAYLRTSIRNPNAYIVPGYQGVMPPFLEDQMSEEQLDAIVAYLLSQGAEPPELEDPCPATPFEEVMASYSSSPEIAAAP